MTDRANTIVLSVCALVCLVAAFPLARLGQAVAGSTPLGAVLLGACFVAAATLTVVVGVRLIRRERSRRRGGAERRSDSASRATG